MTRKSLLILGMIGLVFTAVLVGCWWKFCKHAGQLKLHGVVEIQEVRLGSKVGGRVVEVAVQEGQLVEAGQVVVRFEVPELKAQEEQLMARVRAAETEVAKARKSRDVWDKTREVALEAELAARARWERSKDPWRKEEKKHALSEMNAAKADLVNAQQEYDRISNLYRTNAVTRGEYDAALALRDRAQGRYEMAKARHEMLEAKGRKEDIDEAEHEYKRLRAKREELENGPTPYEELAVAEARLAELQGKLKEIQININEGMIRAPEKAVVEVVAVRPGDLVAPNQPVVRVLRAQDMWVKVYVPETELGKLRLGQPAEVYCDAYPNHKFPGRVIQVATISEFTPRNVQSVDERRHQVFAVKIRVDDPQGVFRSGMAAQVVLPLTPAP